MLSKKILIESRISDFERVFDRKFSGEQKEKILNDIPSKFYQWTGKNLDQISFDENFELVKNIIDKAYWPIYGEMNILDELNDNGETCLEKSRCPEASGKYYSFGALMIYMIVANVLLINLLIAMFR